MTTKKIIGWILLISGLLIIFWTLYSSYNIFTAKVEAPEIFKVKEEETLSPKDKSAPASSEELQKEMREAIEEQIKDMIPSEFFTKLLNLISWSIFAGILIFGGSITSGIGIKLLRRK